LGLLDRIFGLHSASITPSRDEAYAAAIIERVVDATDKRLRLVPDYQKVLREGALTTLEHIKLILQTIPGPVAVSGSAWNDSRALRPFFARPTDVPIPFSRSRDARAFFAATMADECTALLAFEHTEREVVAPRVGSDGIQREEAYTTVSFNKPLVLAPNIDLQATRIELGKRTVDYLALKALAQIAAQQHHKKELQEEQALLRMRLQMARSAGHGLSGMGGDDVVARVDAAALTRDLEANAQALAGYAATGTMNQFLEALQQVLGHPADWLRVASSPLALDDMNVKCADPQTAAIAMQICDLHLVDRPLYTVMIAQFPRAELLPEQDLWRAAEQM
jgi:hypothetical protein